MTSDPVLDRFAGIDVPDGFAVPGRRPTAASRRSAEEEVVAPGWDADPVVYRFGGEEQEFFTIRHLAAALGRSAVTIRSWENRGLLPRTPYSSPRPRRGTLPGRQPKGKRLWTRDQVLGILRIAAEENVILDNGAPPTEQFAKRVLALFQQTLNDSH